MDDEKVDEVVVTPLTILHRKPQEIRTAYIAAVTVPRDPHRVSME